MNLTTINKDIEKLSYDERNKLTQSPIYIIDHVSGNLYEAPIFNINLPILSSIPNAEQILDSEYLKYNSLNFFSSINNFFGDDVYDMREYIHFIYCAEECLAARLEARSKKLNGNGCLLLGEVYEVLGLRVPKDVYENPMCITTNNKNWHYL